MTIKSPQIVVAFAILFALYGCGESESASQHNIEGWLATNIPQGTSRAETIELLKHNGYRVSDKGETIVASRPVRGFLSTDSMLIDVDMDSSGRVASSQVSLDSPMP
jgi:hypothetical protein